MNKYSWLNAWLMAKPGAEKDYKEEWGWHRYLLCGKMFAATCRPGPEHHEHAGREMVILKCDPMLAVSLRQQYAEIVPGFYSNKEHWNSVYLDGDLPDELLKGLCDMSWKLIFQKLPKRIQKEITENA